jgi:hypothetical protein
MSSILGSQESAKRGEKRPYRRFTLPKTRDPNPSREFPNSFWRDCPKRGKSNAPGMNLAGVQRTEATEKGLLGSPLCYAASPAGTFRTVSEDEFSEVR